jgi:hypothetical protein
VLIKSLSNIEQLWRKAASVAGTAVGRSSCPPPGSKQPDVIGCLPSDETESRQADEFWGANDAEVQASSFRIHPDSQGDIHPRSLTSVTPKLLTTTMAVADQRAPRLDI